MYDRYLAVQYAETYWNSYNPAFRYFPTDDCTNFVSQCLYAGGVPMNFSQKPNHGWWYRKIDGKKDSWSYSWTVAHSLYAYLKGVMQPVSSAQQLELGDVICYDWEGDGRWNHNVIVTQKDIYGEPYVNAHTVNSQHRFWRYEDSSSWTPQTRYAFFHIV